MTNAPQNTPDDYSNEAADRRRPITPPFARAKFWLELIQAVGIISGIIYGFKTIDNFQDQMELVRHQAELQNRITRAAVISSASQRLETLNKIMFDHPELAQYVTPEFNPAKMPWKAEHDSERVITYYYGTMNVFDEVAGYYRLDLMSEEDWRAWARSFQKTIKLPAFEIIWPEIKDEYSETFQHTVDSLMSEK